MRPHGVQVEHAATQKNRSHQTQILVRLFLENDGGGGDGGDEVRVCVCRHGGQCVRGIVVLTLVRYVG